LIKTRCSRMQVCRLVLLVTGKVLFGRRGALLVPARRWQPEGVVIPLRLHVSPSIEHRPDRPQVVFQVIPLPVPTGRRALGPPGGGRLGKLPGDLLEEAPGPLIPILVASRSVAARACKSRSTAPRANRKLSTSDYESYYANKNQYAPNYRYSRHKY